MGDPQDKDLGMHRDITRRDFLNGVAVTAGAAVIPPHVLAALQNNSDPEKSTDYYPPALTGLRGSHVGSFEVAHSIRDHEFWEKAPKPIETGEKFDLIVVGGGISGLSAAHFYRKANPSARVLILDNHDDFGGNAKRNEFMVGGYRRLGFGGTFSIESPAPYSSVAKEVVEELGIDVSSYPKYFAKGFYRSLGLLPSVFFDKQTFGADVLAPGSTPFESGETGESSFTNSTEAWNRFLQIAPLSPAAKQDF
ncbi:MAG TPA: FAD-dependent oxidoreductase, partial [Chthoniobacterales bacterium]